MNSPIHIRNIFFSLLFLTLFLGVGACSNKITFPVSSVIPTAEPNARVNKTSEGEYRIRLDVSGLALPDRLTPSKKHYVVWIESEGQGTRNLGELRNNRGMMANRSKASFEATTRFKPTQIFVTAENSTSLQWPGDHEILRSNVFRIK